MSRRVEFAQMIGAVLLALGLWLGISQIPTAHTVDIGGADAAYVQGMGEREQADAPAAQPYLVGANNARALANQAALLFPQAGSPGSLVIRWRTIGSTPISVSLLLNGAVPLQTVIVPTQWSETRFQIAGGQTKRSGDWFIAFAVAQPETVYLDRVIYRVDAPPIMPAPVPWAATGLTAALLVGLLPGRWRWWMRSGVAAGAVVLALALLYRAQPPIIPYPIRRAPFLLVGGLLAAQLIRWSPVILRRPRMLEWALVGTGLLAWVGWLWTHQAQHVVLSLPGVEADFSVFAKRSATWDAVFRADGFYQIGYPTLLRLVRPLVDDSPFNAARLLSVGAALVFAAATWATARVHWGRTVGIFALLLVALNPLVVQSALTLGTDMPFAAACALTVLLAIRANSRQFAPRFTLIGTGMMAGVAFSIRHPGLLLLPWALVLAVVGGRWSVVGGRKVAPTSSFLVPISYILLGWLLAAGPQIAVNLRDTGQPLYSQQAKNIWLAVYGNTEYRRWDEENSAISLFEVVQRDPVRFGENWSGNIVAFAGSGGARSAEFERAVQLRLLAWPFNLLALAGLGIWMVRWRRERFGRWLLVWAGLYLVGISVGFLLPRFALPLVQVYVVAAAWLVGRWGSGVGGRGSGVVALLIVVVCAPQAQAGAQNVLNQQLKNERAIAQAISTNVPADAAIAALVEPRTAIGKYSAVAHRLTNSENAPPADIRWLVAQGTAPAGWRLVVAAGNLGLYSR